jgi:hypothetical protein
MLYSLSSEDRQKLGNFSKQIRAKLGGTDCRLVAIVYAIFVCQSVQKSPKQFPGLNSALAVKLPDFLSDIFVTDYLLNSDTEASLEKQSLIFKVTRIVRIIKALAKVNEAQIDLVKTDKLIVDKIDQDMADWLEQSIEKLSFQLLLLENIAPPLELISFNPSLPAEVFNLLIKISESANNQATQNTIPADLASLVALAFPVKSGEVVVDLNFGLGNMITAAMKESEGVTFYGQEADSLSALLGWLRIKLTPSDNEVNVKVGDALTHGHELESKMRPVDLAYVYSSSPWVVRDETKSLKNYDDETVIKLVNIKHMGMERWAAASEKVKEIAAEIYHRKSGLALVEPNNEKSQKNYLDIIESLEKKLARATSIADQLKKEFEVTKNHLNSLRSSSQVIGGRFGESRDSKLMKHALETVHESGTVVAVVSSRNLFSISSLRLLNECLNKNWLDTIVELPRGSAGTNDRIAILVFRKNRKDKDVLFVDATNVSVVTTSSDNQNAQAVTDIFASALIRRTKASDFSEEFVTRLVDIIKNRIEHPSVSTKVPFQNLESEDKSSVTIITDLRPQKYLAKSAAPKQSIESLHKSLDAAIKQTFESAKALQNARSELGLERLPTLFSKPSVDRPKIT